VIAAHHLSQTSDAGADPVALRIGRIPFRTLRYPRLRYMDGPPQWGNLVGPCRMPPQAVTLRFWIFKHRSAPQAAMHLWLLEPDGDAWVQQVLVNGLSVGTARSGWHVAWRPVGGFRFEARGRWRTRSER